MRPYLLVLLHAHSRELNYPARTTRSRERADNLVPSGVGLVLANRPAACYPRAALQFPLPLPQMLPRDVACSRSPG